MWHICTSLTFNISGQITFLPSFGGALNLTVNTRPKNRGTWQVCFYYIAPKFIKMQYLKSVLSVDNSRK